MDEVPENTIISLDTLERFIEKYPEDAEKWLEFIRVPPDDPLSRLRRNVAGNLNEDILRINTDLYNIEPITPIDHFNDGCLHCKKSWTSTDGVPTITLICGHKFHTVCTMIHQYESEFSRCIVDECNINTWDYVRSIMRTKEKTVEITENILLDSYKKRTDFKADFKELKYTMNKVASSYNLVSKMILEGKKEFVHKHLYNINQLQKDMNEGLEYINNSEQMIKYKKALKNYRKSASLIFRKYHVSYRDMRQRGLLRHSWRLRSILERHRTGFSFYKLGIRIYPGRKSWKDPLA